MNKYLLLFLLTTLTLFSCNKEEAIEEMLIPTSPFAGKWTGTFVGSAANNSGILIMSISEGGLVAIEVTTMNAVVINEAIGKITDDGRLTADITQAAGGSMEGMLDLNMGRGQGNWTQTETNNGTWFVERDN